MEDRFGLLVRDTNVRDWIAGSFSPVEPVIYQPLGQWDYFLPTIEYQSNNGEESWMCTIFSLTNALEMLHIRQTGIEINFSDAWLGKLSGTVKGFGNFLDDVFDYARKNGLVLQSRWANFPDPYREIPQEIRNEGKDFLANWSLYREWVNPTKKDDIKRALREAPLQVTVRYAEGNGLLKPTGTHNHAVTLYGYEDEKWFNIYDHYTQTRKRYAWDYEFGAVLKPSLIKKTNNFMFTPQDNTLYLLVQGPEQILTMGLNGKLIKYDEKIDALINSASRSKKYQIPVPITMEQYNSCEKLDGKGNKIA